jgi:WD40 repeat protein
VFISYSHDHVDRRYVERLARYLSNSGISVWYDPDLATGERWVQILQQRIDTCAAFVVVMSPAAEASDWVDRELGQAEHIRRPVFPLLLDGEVFFRIRNLQYENVLGGRMPSRALVQRLRELVPRAAADVDAGGLASAGWVMTGPEGDEGARGHFTSRGRGQRGYAGVGDLFRGRQSALAVVSRWLTATDPPGRVLVVTGQPGAGKSAVAARAVLDDQQSPPRPGAPARCGVAFHARNAVLADLFTAVSDATGTDPADSIPGFIDHVRDHHGVVALVVDALDEASSDSDRDAIIQALRDLAQLPLARVVVATRPMATGNRFAPGTLLSALGVRSANDTNLIDLDTDHYFDPIGMRDFVTALLRQDNQAHPTPPDGAWATYRDNPAQCARLAAMIARTAGRNHLVAALTADPLARADIPIDPTVPDFDPVTLPVSIGEALTKYLNHLTPRDREHTRSLLTALAYGRGVGLDDQQWLTFAATLGYPATTLDLDVLRRSSAADYLLQTAQRASATLTRLFHQAFTDELLAPRHDQRGFDEQRILTAILPRPPANWADATNYARTFAADHAARAGRLSDLLADPTYPTVADLDRLVPLLPPSPPPHLASVIAIIRAAAHRARTLPPDQRVRLYHLTGAQLGLPTTSTGSGPTPHTVVWGHTLGTPHQNITGHTNWVNGVAIGRVGDREVFVSGSDDNTVRVWDAATGHPLGDPLTGHTDAVSGVAIGRVGDCDVIVSASWDRTVRVWDAATGGLHGDPLTGHTDAVSGVAIGRVGERDVIVSGSYDQTVRVWDASTGRAHGDPLGGHTSWVRAVAIGRIGEQDVIISAGRDRTVRVWDAATGRQRGEPLTGHTNMVNGVAIGRVGERDVIVSGSDDETVQVWNAATGRPHGQPFVGHTHAVTGVAIGRIGDGHAIVSASWDRTVRVWDEAFSHPLGDPLIGHTHAVNGVAIGRIGDHDVIVSGSYDGRVGVWDAATGHPHGHPPAGHFNWVTGVAIGRVGTRDVIVSASWGPTVRVWDAATGRPHGDPLTGHTNPVTGVGLGRIGKRDVVVSGSDDGTVRVWDAATGRPHCRPLIGHTDAVTCVAIGRVDDRDVVVSAGKDHAVRVWDAATGHPHGDPLTGHTDVVSAVAFGRVDDRDVIVSASWDRTVRVWDAATGRPHGEPLIGHTDMVSGLAICRVDDRCLIVSGGADRTVRVWDAALRRVLTTQDTLEPVAALAATGNHIAVAAGRAVIVAWHAAESAPLGKAAVTRFDSLMQHSPWC